MANVSARVETVQTDGFTMDYCRFGQGKDALVILPGMSVQRVMLSANAVAQSYARMAEDFSCYVFERRNDMPAGYTVRNMARDTAAAIQALGLGPVRLFGASQGGMMALLIAMEHPDLVRGLVLGSTSAQVTEAQYCGVFEKWAALARAGDAAALYLAFGEALYPKRMFGKLRPLLHQNAKAVTEEDLRRFIVQAEAMKGFDIRHDLAKVACPTLVIGDTEDNVFGGEASARLAEGIKGCELYMYDGYGHAVYDLAPDYRDRMRKFLIPENETSRF